MHAGPGHIWTFNTELAGFTTLQSRVLLRRRPRDGLAGRAPNYP